METDAGVGSEAEHVPPQKCPFGMLTRTTRRAQFAAPSSHGAGSGLCSTRLQQLLAFFGLWLQDSISASIFTMTLCVWCVCGGVCVCVWYVCVSGVCMWCVCDMCVCACTCILCVVWNLSLWCEVLPCVPVLKTCMSLQVLGIRMWVFFQEAIFWPAVLHLVDRVWFYKAITL